MGVSTDGILFFGINLGDDEDREELLPWEEEGEEGDWGDFVTRKLGIVHPDEEDGPLVDAYYLQKHIALIALGCEVQIHGAESCCAQAVVVKSSYKSASRGFPEKLSQEFLNSITEEDITKLKKFCELMGVEYQEPSWILTSWWG